MKMGGSSSPLIYRSLRFRDKKIPFRYIIVEITAQLVYSFFQESSFNGTMHKSKGVTPMQQYSFE